MSIKYNAKRLKGLKKKKVSLVKTPKGLAIQTEMVIWSSYIGVDSFIIYKNGIATKDYVLYFNDERGFYDIIVKEDAAYEVEYIGFGSAAEFNHYLILKTDKNITEIIPQFPIKISKTIKYIADFKVSYKDGRTEYIDVKGYKTAVYILKKRLLKDLHDIEIIEVQV